jgi:RNA polymerase sigma-70 factor, ECF subfamily
MPLTPPASLTLAEFEELLRGVADAAYGTALRMTGNRQDAEDLLQEASLAAFRGRASFRAGSQFRAWFFKILMNCFYATHRKARAAISLDDVEDSHDMYLYVQTAMAGLHAGGDPVGATIGRLASEDIARALDSLPEVYRSACTMYFMEDFTYEEIGDILSIPLGTVRSRLNRGRRFLQKRLWRLAVDQGIVPKSATDPQRGKGS